jgi:hypothetical protein
MINFSLKIHDHKMILNEESEQYMFSIDCRDGSAKSFSNSHSHFWPSPPHSIAPLLHCIRIAFFALFASFFTVSAPKVVKSEKNVRKMRKSAKNAQKFKTQMRCKNGNIYSHQYSHIASHYYSKNNSHFRTFLHRTTIPD